MYNGCFYRPGYQKLLMYPLIKRLSRIFVSKNLFQKIFDPLKSSAVLLRKLKARLRISKAQPSVSKTRLRDCVITQPMLSQSATVLHRCFHMGVLKYTFFKQLRSGFHPQSCLYFQRFWGSKLLSGCLVVWPSNLCLRGIQ